MNSPTSPDYDRASSGQSSVSSASFQFVPSPSSQHELPSPRSDMVGSSWVGRARALSASAKREKKNSLEGNEVSSQWTYDPDPFAASNSAHGHGPYATYSYASTRTSSVPQALDSTSTTASPKKRLSLLQHFPFSAASRRRKLTLRKSPPSPSRLPDVIEISGPAPGQGRREQDEEDEERERLRDAAAQSIGLSSVMLSDESHGTSMSPHTSFDEDEEARPIMAFSDPWADPDVHVPERALSIDATTSYSGLQYGRGSSLSVAVPPSSPPLTGNRRRAGSLAQSLFHSRQPSSSEPHIPAFPCSHSALTAFLQSYGTFPKFYVSSSLFAFSASNQWKMRFLVLTTPSPITSKSHLHLFKSNGAEEKEIERLEINENTQIVADAQDITGRRNVLKISGKEAGSQKRDLNPQDGGQTMWFLQIIDPDETDKWTLAINGAVQARKTELARLGMPLAPTTSRNEPLTATLRSGTLPSNLLLRTPLPPPPDLSALHVPGLAPERKFDIGASPMPAPRSMRPALIRGQGGTGAPVSALRGLFRSPSPLKQLALQREREQEHQGSPFSEKPPTPKSGLFGKLRSNSIGGSMDMASILSSPIGSPVLSPTEQKSSLVPSLSLSFGLKAERPSIQTEKPVDWSSIDKSRQEYESPTDRPMSPGSLLPPPRHTKRPWTSTGSPVTPHSEKSIPISTARTSFYGPSALFGTGTDSDGGGTPPPFSPESPGTGRSFGSPEETVREGSYATSVSSRTSAERDQSSSEHATPSNYKRLSTASSVKRWSRAGGPLPKMSSPPTGPPPSVPFAQINRSSTSIPEILHPYAAERSPSRASVKSMSSGMFANLPTFRRMSSSSVRSATSGIDTPFPRSRPVSRQSLPPPRPAPSIAPPPIPPLDLPRSRSDSTPATKVTFKETITHHRAFRLSLTPPPPPPSSVLPPRPDEPGYKLPHRNDSEERNGSAHSTLLYTIPQSPMPPPLLAPVPVAPPPTGPLPPTPLELPLSLLRRASESRRGSLSSNVVARTDSPTLSHFPTKQRPLPSTPIGEPILTSQNEANFLFLASPLTPTTSFTIIRPPSPAASDTSELNHSVTSLSPPPRRGSRQISLSDSHRDKFELPSSSLRHVQHSEAEGKIISRQDSAVSLGFVSMS